jgi:hypothetical protein
MRLIAEIVVSLGRARRELRRAPIDAAVARLRRTPSTERTSDNESTRQATPRGRPAPAPDLGATRAASEASPALVEAHRLGAAVMRTLALLPGDTRCLARSLVLTQLLARREIPATLVIGARTGPDFLAHAWVEHAGAPVLPPGEGSFARLVEL